MGSPVTDYRNIFAENIHSRNFKIFNFLFQLQDDGVAPTDDSPKQDYSYEDGKYKFNSITSKVIALRHSKEFHQSAENGDVGVILEKTNFYAEQVNTDGRVFDGPKIVSRRQQTRNLPFDHFYIYIGAPHLKTMIHSL